MTLYRLDMSKWQEIMSLLHEKEGLSIAFITREVIMTYSHSSKIIKELHNKKLIKKKIEGRVAIITPTAKGKKVAESCNLIYKALWSDRR